MSLPAPNLDDRTFDDIMREAFVRISEKNPSWTDFNPSDPGVTIVELFAWMTETILYRLNRVPERNYVKFLELIGLSLLPAQPARTWVVFTVAEGAPEADLGVVPARSRVSTSRSANEPVVFETRNHLHLTAARFLRVVARYGEELSDLTDSALAPADARRGPAALPRVTPHLLFLASEHLQEAGAAHLFRIHVEPGEGSYAGVAVEWECWNGAEWEIVVPRDDGSQGFAKAGTIVFEDLPAVRPYTVHGISARWIRARLLSASGAAVPPIVSLRQSLQLRPGFALRPQAGYVADETPQFFPIDFSLAFRPFAGWPHPDARHYVPPQPGNALYLGSPLFARSGNTVTVSVTMSRHYTPASTDVVSDLLVRWEYYSVSGSWKTIGTSRHTGVEESHLGFSDTTDAFTESGEIRFTVPDDAAASEVHRDEAHWVRARLERGTYGPKQENAPMVENVALSFEDKPDNFDHAVSSNYFDSQEITAALNGPEAVTPFVVSPENDPMLYLCLGSKPSAAVHSVYVQLADEESPRRRVVWEYYGPNGEWRSLALSSDSTDGFARTGLVSFIPPDDWSKAAVYEAEGFWLRCRWVAATGRYSPPIEMIRMNGVEVEGARTVFDEVLGSATGAGKERFSFADAPILPDPVVLVREVDNPSSEQVRSYRDEFGDDVRVTGEGEGGGAQALWVRWYPVPSFLDSGPDSRHFVLDPLRGTLRFGDGTRGRIPPAGSRNIRCESYRVCLGAAGNVGRGSIATLDRPVPYVEEISNPVRATGGSDAETMDEAKRRGPWTIRHRERAVTAEDFEHLAHEASGEVAKATCSVEDGVVTVTVIPRSASAKPKPGVVLLHRVRDYLDRRRLVTTKLRVEGPAYEDVSLDARVVAAVTVADIPGLRSKIEAQLRGFVHPLNGGPNGTGWPLGRAVHVSEIHFLLERIPGVDYVSEVKLNGSAWTQRVDIPARVYPFFADIAIEIASG